MRGSNGTRSLAIRVGSLSHVGIITDGSDDLSELGDAVGFIFLAGGISEHKSVSGTVASSLALSVGLRSWALVLGVSGLTPNCIGGRGGGCC